jgi:hypothetical protein
MKYQNYDEWKEEGFYVRKGEKSILRCPVLHQPLFNEKQVEYYERCDESDIYWDDIY